VVSCFFLTQVDKLLNAPRITESYYCPELVWETVLHKIAKRFNLSIQILAIPLLLYSRVYRTSYHF